MYLMGFSLNNLSLMALTIATGFVVDDAIVMIENISRHLERGEKPMAAALRGAREIGFTIISLTVSLIAVLIPLLFMGDVVGRLFREFAITLAITILISAVVSLTLTPMLSARWLKSAGEEHQGRIARKSQAAFERIEHHYERALNWVLARQKATLVVAVGTLALTALLYMVIPKGLFPTQDTGQLQARTEVEQSVSYERMAGLQQDAARAILDDPAVESLSSFIGVDGANNAMLHTGQMLINLKADRKGSQETIMQRLRDRVAAVPGVHLYLQPTQDLTIDAETGPTLYRLSLEGAAVAKRTSAKPASMEPAKKPIGFSRPKRRTESTIAPVDLPSSERESCSRPEAAWDTISAAGPACLSFSVSLALFRASAKPCMCDAASPLIDSALSSASARALSPTDVASSLIVSVADCSGDGAAVPCLLGFIVLLDRLGPALPEILSLSSIVCSCFWVVTAGGSERVRPFQCRAKLWRPRMFRGRHRVYFCGFLERNSIDRGVRREEKDHALPWEDQNERAYPLSSGRVDDCSWPHVGFDWNGNRRRCFKGWRRALSLHRAMGLRGCCHEFHRDDLQQWL